MRETTKSSWPKLLRQHSSQAVTRLDSTWRSLSNSHGSRGLAKLNLKSRNVQKIVYNVRLTIFCSIITILVLRGTVGTGMFGGSSTPSKFPNRMEQRFFEEENAHEDPPIDVSVPFALGVNVSNWDELRSEWVGSHQSLTKNTFGKDRVLLVSGSAAKPCRSAVGDHFLVKSLKNKVDYTRLHDIDLYYNMAVLDTQMTGVWVKHPMVRSLMLSHPEAEWIWWMDSDAFFTDMAFEIPFDKYQNHNMILHGFQDELLQKRSWMGINAGSFLLRNCQWSLDLLDVWTSYGHPRVANQVGQMLSEVLTDRPVFDSDDQSVLAYMLVTQPVWLSKVFLENSYFLHGFWMVLVDRYEKIMATSRPGYGDTRWPFVTHFLGCKPCGNEATHEIQLCLKQMQRAFNFGDNQILEPLGYQHRTLNSSKELGMLRHDTANPLGLDLAAGAITTGVEAV